MVCNTRCTCRRTRHFLAAPIDLQTAINTASAGDSVFVAQGLYQPPSGVWYTLKEGVKIYGGFAGTETTLAERNLSAQLYLHT